MFALLMAFGVAPLRAGQQSTTPFPDRVGTPGREYPSEHKR
jgi:hypothetical protein